LVENEIKETERSKDERDGERPRQKEDRKKGINL
jgi:hypothetical protein